MRCIHFLVACAFILPPAAANSAVLGVDGILGSEWSGSVPVGVGYDAAAPTSNFAIPSADNHLIAYDVYFRSDANFIYGALAKNSVADDPTGTSPDFANVYFNRPEGGSSFGVEILNERFFVPGVAGYYDAGSNLEYALAGAGTEAAILEFAIPLSYLLDDPDNLLTTDYQLGDRVRINLTQAFGYSVAGGQSNFGDDRLGITTITPLPPALAFLASGLLGLAGLHRLRSRAGR